MAVTFLTSDRHILYITRDNRNRDFFEEVIKAGEFREDNLYHFNYDTKLIGSPIGIYKLISDFNKLYQRKLYVIIDYLSYAVKPYYYWDDSIVKIIQYAILCFPEINFYFDETLNLKREGHDYSDFIGISGFDSNFHQFNVDDIIQDKSFKSIFEKNNLFDSSGIRLKILSTKLCGLDVEDNFKKVHDSRLKNLCYSVEEEHSQSLFNCYCMYANGYRVLPVESAFLLKLMNEKTNTSDEKPQLIIRDFDLQFPDEATVAINGDSISSWQTVDLIRGFKKVNGKWQRTTTENPFWGHLSVPTIFISKGVDGLSFIREPVDVNNEEVKELCGIIKPVAGLFKPFEGLYDEIIHNVYEGSIDDRPLVTTRKNNNHSVPLDLYSFIKSMISRAQDYYESGHFIYSALVADVAMELLNGFHVVKMLEAYHIKVMAENAIASNIPGCNEESLAEDTRFRLKEIKRTVYRIGCRHVGDISRCVNLVMQIYSNIRNFCRDKRYLEVENTVVEAMARTKERHFHILRDIIKYHLW